MKVKHLRAFPLQSQDYLCQLQIDTCSDDPGYTRQVSCEFRCRKPNAVGLAWAAASYTGL